VFDLLARKHFVEDGGRGRREREREREEKTMFDEMYLRSWKIT